MKHSSADSLQALYWLVWDLCGAWALSYTVLKGITVFHSWLKKKMKNSELNQARNNTEQDFYVFISSIKQWFPMKAFWY